MPRVDHKPHKHHKHRPATLDTRHGLGHLLPQGKHILYLYYSWIHPCFFYCCLMLMDKILQLAWSWITPFFTGLHRKERMRMNAAILENLFSPKLSFHVCVLTKRLVFTRSKSYGYLNCHTIPKPWNYFSLIIFFWWFTPLVTCCRLLAGSEKHTGTVVECWPPQALWYEEPWNSMITIDFKSAFWNHHWSNHGYL